MKTEINNVNINLLQEQLDTEIGSGMFMATVDTNAYKFYLEYSDTIDATLVSKALDLASKEANRKFTEIRNRLYDQIDRMSQKTILRYKPAPPTEELLAKATTWLADITQPCPKELQTMSILKSIDEKTLAEQIVANNSAYNLFLIDVNNMKEQTLSQLLIVTSVLEAKTVATLAANYFNDLEKNFSS